MSKLNYSQRQQAEELLQRMEIQLRHFTQQVELLQNSILEKDQRAAKSVLGNNTHLPERTVTRVQTTESYVCEVPDYCDRIIWRNKYIHLESLK